MFILFLQLVTCVSKDTIIVHDQTGTYVVRNDVLEILFFSNAVYKHATSFCEHITSLVKISKTQQSDLKHIEGKVSQ